MLQDKSLRTSSARRANFGFRAIVSGNDLRVKERRSCTRHSSRNLVSVNYHIIDDTIVSVLGLFQSRIIVTKLWYNGDTIVSVAKLKQCEVAILRLPSDNQLPSVSPARGPTSVNVSVTDLHRNDFMNVSQALLRLLHGNSITDFIPKFRSSILAHGFPSQWVHLHLSIDEGLDYKIREGKMLRKYDNEKKEKKEKKKTKTYGVLGQLADDILHVFDDYLPIFIFFVEIGHKVFQKRHHIGNFLRGQVRWLSFFDLFLGLRLDDCIAAFLVDLFRVNESYRPEVTVEKLFNLELSAEII